MKPSLNHHYSNITARPSSLKRYYPVLNPSFPRVGPPQLWRQPPLDLEVYRGAVEFRRAEVLSMERLERMRGPEGREEAMAIMGHKSAKSILEETFVMRNSMEQHTRIRN